MKIKFILLYFIIFSLSANKLKPLMLCDDLGGYADGKIWKSDFLLGKINVLIYADPDKFSDIKSCVADLKKGKATTNSFGLTFIVNTEATMIPTFLIKSKMRKKAKNSPNISYVLDNDKVLVDKWNLRDDSINILVLDSLNEIKYQNKDGIYQSKEIINQIRSLQ